ncbi:helix-turn-helix domain-containing protein [Acinetobacter sp. YH12211]|uniref:helix-turn-helix domain-containing protein n=1 Tax=Acinetobacter sp. YH12211 TaxID=2601147 RepID=UPI00211E455C|nr:helix-turn-helix domain-containing protein [Acinetobacter sp. YH12211]
MIKKQPYFLSWFYRLFCEPTQLILRITMTLLTIVEASKQFGVTRSRIYRAIDRGEITPQVNDDGAKVIDAADMVRVFGTKASTRKTAPNKSDAMPARQSEQIVEILQEQLKQAQEREQFYKAEIANIRKDFDDFKLMITHNPTPAPRTEGEQPEHLKQGRTDEPHEQQGIERNDRGVTEKKEQPKRGFWGRFFP